MEATPRRVFGRRGMGTQVHIPTLDTSDEAESRVQLEYFVKPSVLEYLEATAGPAHAPFVAGGYFYPMVAGVEHLHPSGRCRQAIYGILVSEEQNRPVQWVARIDSWNIDQPQARQTFKWVRAKNARSMRTLLMEVSRAIVRIRNVHDTEWLMDKERPSSLLLEEMREHIVKRSKIPRSKRLGWKR